jgi:hypothetical protein
VWFTADWIDSIPDDMLPKLFTATMAPQPALGPAGKLRRRTSVRKSLIGALISDLGPAMSPALAVPDAAP